MKLAKLTVVLPLRIWCVAISVRRVRKPAPYDEHLVSIDHVRRASSVRERLRVRAIACIEDVDPLEGRQ